MIVDVIIILAGAALIGGRKALLRGRAIWQKENFGTKVGPKDVKFGEILAIVLGVASIIFGLLGVFGLIK